MEINDVHILPFDIANKALQTNLLLVVMFHVTIITTQPADLVEGVHHGKVAQQGHSKHLAEEVGTQQVGVQLVLIKVSAPHEDLGQQPVVLWVSGEEDGVVLSWLLLQLWRGETRGQAQTVERRDKRSGTNWRGETKGQAQTCWSPQSYKLVS